MPLQTSDASEAERRQIEREWETERSYTLANLTSARRSGLRFVKAQKTDEEWTRHARAGLEGLDKPKTIDEIAQDNARWYRELVGDSIRSSSAPGTRDTSAPLASGDSHDSSALPAVQSKTSAINSRPTIASQTVVVHGAGSKDAPYSLEDSDDEVGRDTPSPVATAGRIEIDAVQAKTDLQHMPGAVLGQTSISGPQQNTRAVKNAPEDSLSDHQESSAASLATSDDIADADSVEDEITEIAAEEAQDMYCLLCKVIVPKSDVRGHRTSILHQLSKSTNGNMDQPLVPPTYYGVRSSNVGYGMLQRLGWVEDTGLGSTQLGRKTPLRAIEKFDRTGVGVNAKKRAVEEEQSGKVSANKRNTKPTVAKPLAKNRRELRKARKDEMQMFKEGLAYLNS